MEFGAERLKQRLQTELQHQQRELEQQQPQQHQQTGAVPRRWIKKIISVLSEVSKPIKVNS